MVEAGVADPEAARRPDRFWRLVLRDETRRDGGGQRRGMLPPIPRPAIPAAACSPGPKL